MPPDCIIELPDNFRKKDFLDFHRRDALMLAERVKEDTLEKGIIWDKCAACVSIRFLAQQVEAELNVDDPASGPRSTACERIARRMLGLTQEIDAFEQRCAEHLHVGRLVAQRSGLRVPLAATPYEALTWAIIGQQISVKAAVSVRRNFIGLAGVRHSSGLWCYPDAERVSQLTENDLRGAGFSMSKARTVLELSRRICQDLLILHDVVDEVSAEEIRANLLQIRGIGPWTVNYTLLRGFGWLDGELHGDVVVRRGIQVLLDSSEKITEEQAKSWLAPFSPWRALVAAHLWAMQSHKA